MKNGHSRAQRGSGPMSELGQLLDAIAPDRRDDAKLGKMNADCIDHRGLPANEEMARAVERQSALLLGRLGLDEPHVWPAHGLADRLRISRIVLLALNVGLHVRRRHQSNLVAKRLQLTRPMMGRSAGFDADQARRHLLKERQNKATLELATEDDIALRIDTVNVKN